MQSRLRWICVLVLFAGTAAGEQPSSWIMHVALEQQVKGTSHFVSQQHVFRRGDMVRLRLRSERNGYLTVFNRGSSGVLTALFPNGTDGNKVTQDREYTLPLDGGWFKIDDPPGYETLYFLLSPIPLKLYQEPSVKPSPAHGESFTATPRCDDEMFRSRGECLDITAGARALEDSKVPESIGAGEISRDVDIVPQAENGQTVKSHVTNKPVMYELRIAHR